MQSLNRRPSFVSGLFIAGFLLLGLSSRPAIHGQEKQQPEIPAATPTSDAPIEIADEPKTIDPATLVPAFLSVPATVVFDGSPLKSVFTWLQKDQKINVLVDYKALADAKILETEPVYDSLKDAPIYLLLNRLEAKGVGWYLQDESLYVTSRNESRTHTSIISYNFGDLFDAGYSSRELLSTITRCTGGQWTAESGPADAGTILPLGDIAFIRQTDNIHREVAGLLAAIRKHGRRTLSMDSPGNDALRAAMEVKIMVDFQETPLIVAVQEISAKAQIDIRLDRVALANDSIRDRTPVSLKLVDQKLSAVLRTLLSGLNLNWYFRDDVLWITTTGAANAFHKTAVYDVRDLCRDQDESAALKQAIQKQSRVHLGGVMDTPVPGVLVVRHTETVLDGVLRLLENYRIALRASKRRTVPAVELDPAEIVTGYYRLPRPLANDLALELPKLILPKTWKSDDQPDAVGTIRDISIDKMGGFAVPSENIVLMIRQSREAHQLIGKQIQALLNSTAIDVDATANTTKNRESKPSGFGSRLIPAAN